MARLGQIKCTFAELFDENGKKLYSLQARHFFGSAKYPFYEIGMTEDGRCQVGLTEHALRQIAATSDVALPEKIYVKAGAVRWAKETRKLSAGVILAAALALVYLVKKER
jgi:hypothetical protein